MHISFIVSIISLFIIFIAGFIVAHFVNESTYMTIDFNKAFINPCLKYPFGTNNFGQNLFYQTLVGCYNTLILAIVTTFIKLIIGITIGIIWGNSNKFDFFFNFIKSIFDNVPLIFFYIILITALGANYLSLLIVVVVFGWVNIACLIRNNLVIIRTKDYNVASKLYKTPLYKRAIKNYFPSILPIIFSSIALSIPEIISFEITLSYFGFILGEKNLGLGKILYASITSNHCFTHPFLFVIPLLLLLIINLCFYLISKTIASVCLNGGDSDVESK